MKNVWVSSFPALDLEPPVAARQNVMVSRSFSKDVYALSEIVEAVSVYATRVGEKLRHRKKQNWSRREQWSSPRYTTRWEEILRVGG